MQSSKDLFSGELTNTRSYKSRYYGDLLLVATLELEKVALDTKQTELANNLNELLTIGKDWLSASYQGNKKDYLPAIANLLNSLKQVDYTQNKNRDFLVKFMAYLVTMIKKPFLSSADVDYLIDLVIANHDSLHSFSCRLLSNSIRALAKLDQQNKQKELSKEIKTLSERMENSLKRCLQTALENLEKMDKSTLSFRDLIEITDMLKEVKNLFSSYANTDEQDQHAKEFIQKVEEKYKALAFSFTVFYWEFKKSKLITANLLSELAVNFVNGNVHDYPHLLMELFKLEKGKDKKWLDIKSKLKDIKDLTEEIVITELIKIFPNLDIKRVNVVPITIVNDIDWKQYSVVTRDADLLMLLTDFETETRNVINANDKNAHWRTLEMFAAIKNLLSLSQHITNEEEFNKAVKQCKNLISSYNIDFVRKKNLNPKEQVIQSKKGNENPVVRIAYRMQAIVKSIDSNFQANLQANSLAESQKEKIDLSYEIKNYKDVTALTELGEGSFATVYKGKWQKQTVAIKAFKFSNLTIKKFEQERDLLLKLTDLQAPNVVWACGYVQDPVAYQIVLEFLPGNDLFHLLENHNKNNTKIDVLTVKHLVEGILSGVKFIHAYEIVHRDIKLENVLLDSQGVAKLSDFGFAATFQDIKEEEVDENSPLKGTPSYLAPEYVKGTGYTTSSDMYSIGILFWEIAHTKEAFLDLAHIRDNYWVFFDLILKGRRETFSNQIEPKFKAIISNLWQADPQKRLSAKAVLEELETPLNQISKKLIK